MNMGMEPHNQPKKELAKSNPISNHPSGTGEDTGFQSMDIPLYTVDGSGIADQSNPALFSIANSSQSGEISFDASAFFEDQPDQLGNIRRKSLAERVLTALTEDPNLKNSIQNITPLSNGGMGLIYQGCHKILGDVVIKVPDPGLAMTPAFQVRFLQEAQRLFGLHHQNVVKVTDAGITERVKLPYYVMELIKAPPFLSEGHFGNYIDFIRAGENRIDWGSGEGRKGIEYVVAVCGAVQELHRCGIIHRDLKPANVMLHSENGRITPKVIDLGVGKSIEEATVTFSESGANSVIEPTEDGALKLTKIGRAVGTPAYMAPEQQRGEATVSSDVYGLGGILCTLLTGKTTIEFKADSHIQYELPKDLRAILNQSLADDPKLRYATPLELQTDLEAWLKKGEVQAYITTMGPGSLIRYRSQRKVEALVSAVKTHPVASGVLLLTILAVGSAAKLRNDGIEAERQKVAQVEKEERELNKLLGDAQIRLGLMGETGGQTQSSGNIPTSSELINSLSKYQDSPKAQQVIQELQEREVELELLQSLRSVVIEGQKKRFNSFQIGEIVPLDVKAFQDMYKVYLGNEFTDTAVEKFAQFINGSKYTAQQRMEIIEAVVLSVMVETTYQLHNLPSSFGSTPEQQRDECLVRINLVQSLLEKVGISQIGEPHRMICYHKVVLERKFGNNKESHEHRLAENGALTHPLYEVTVFLRLFNNILAGNDTLHFTQSINQISSLKRGQLSFGITAIELAIQNVNSETDLLRRNQYKSDLLNAFDRISDYMEDNPYFCAQFGRAALSLGKDEQQVPGPKRSSLNGRIFAAEFLTRAVEMLKAMGENCPPELVRDAGEALILSRERMREGVQLLNSVIDECADRDNTYLTIQVAKAQMGEQLDEDFCRELLANSRLREVRPIDVCFVFARMIGQGSELEMSCRIAIDSQLSKLTEFSPSDIEDVWSRLRSLMVKEKATIN